ncbi:hypothetical protein ABBQ38_009765 [Trebouxia sp. C0009 RCD-2024]
MYCTVGCSQGRFVTVLVTTDGTNAVDLDPPMAADCTVENVLPAGTPPPLLTATADCQAAAGLPAVGPVAAKPRLFRLDLSIRCMIVSCTSQVDSHPHWKGNSCLCIHEYHTQLAVRPEGSPR